MSSLLVPRVPASAALVRRAMTAELQARHLPVTEVDDAALVVSELVGNAVRHGAELPGGGLLARWQLHGTQQEGTQLRVEVVEGGPGPGPQAGRADSDAESGRGLELVRAIAARWGSRAAPDGTAVWAELPVTCPPPGGPAGRAGREAEPGS